MPVGCLHHEKRDIKAKENDVDKAALTHSDRREVASRRVSAKVIHLARSLGSAGVGAELK